jgi:hypothetical protein
MKRCGSEEWYSATSALLLVRIIKFVNLSSHDDIAQSTHQYRGVAGGLLQVLSKSDN